jgi:hypothetical protein
MIKIKCCSYYDEPVCNFNFYRHPQVRVLNVDPPHPTPLKITTVLPKDCACAYFYLSSVDKSYSCGSDTDKCFWIILEVKTIGQMYNVFPISPHQQSFHRQHESLLSDLHGVLVRQFWSCYFFLRKKYLNSIYTVLSTVL